MSSECHILFLSLTLCQKKKKKAERGAKGTLRDSQKTWVHFIGIKSSLDINQFKFTVY